jgi:hypothetical protein
MAELAQLDVRTRAKWRAWLAKHHKTSRGVWRSRLRRFGPIGLIAIVLIVLTGNIVGAALVFGWAWASRTPWQALGFVESKSWTKDLALGLAAGIVFKLLMKAIVMPLLGFGPVNVAFHYLAGNTAALPSMLFTVIVGAGFGEETIWRGFLFERLRTLLGTSTRARFATVIVPAVLFGLAHYHDQGLPGAVQATITGLAFGTAFMLAGRIWPIMIAHAAFDVTAVLLIYWNLEEPIGRVLFR